jgi:hypothetical protein
VRDAVPASCLSGGKIEGEIFSGDDMFLLVRVRAAVEFLDDLARVLCELFGEIVSPTLDGWTTIAQFLTQPFGSQIAQRIQAYTGATSCPFTRVSVTEGMPTVCLTTSVVFAGAFSKTLEQDSWPV